MPQVKDKVDAIEFFDTRLDAAYYVSARLTHGALSCTVISKNSKQQSFGATKARSLS